MSEIQQTHAKELMQGAGAPPELFAAAQAKGVDFGKLYEAAQAVLAIIKDPLRTPWEKVWGIMLVLVDLLPQA